MANNEYYHVNFYVGPMLAQAGELQVSDTQLLFRPTGPIERAMGAKDVAIPLNQINVFEVVGGLSRLVRLKVGDKIYKFEGSDAVRFGEWLTKKLPGKAFQRPPSVQLLHKFVGPKYSCPKCTEILKPGLSFCTRCAARPSPVCTGCQRMIDPEWIHCGYCGAKIVLPNVEL